MTGRIYNANRVALMTTEQIEQRYEKARAAMPKGQGSVREAYYKQVGREQAAKHLQLWSQAKADRAAGLI